MDSSDDLMAVLGLTNTAKATGDYDAEIAQDEENEAASAEDAPAVAAGLEDMCEVRAPAKKVGKTKSKIEKQTANQLI
jgi:hypothetical protein